MNTSVVAKMLGVSQSTVQRWVKQLELEMERNELGHYIFTEEDIQLLRQVQDQLNKGIILQDVTVGKRKIRKGATNTALNEQAFDKLLEKINVLEQKLNGKADDVVSYQLLQHRREIEDLQNEVKKLNVRIEKLEANQNGMKKSNTTDHLLVFDNQMPSKKTKKRKLITTLFGF
ncbi:MerR family transcriptional regulator [Bacillus sp. FJAT-29790]|uniref:MerR family transcriptional regulator n=1 Tax=Bacillus sp. FJAT-29790 TaxID=1895002 RepID=UPI001C21C75A|nr:MerR family transcriptional regulator [Bacillus sp. FJAT-29790]MBU8880755.1 MerR family transcriptional regulator [Bacillus sp. FJAT-29790]